MTLQVSNSCKKIIMSINGNRYQELCHKRSFLQFRKSLVNRNYQTTSELVQVIHSFEFLWKIPKNLIVRKF